MGYHTPNVTSISTVIH